MRLLLALSFILTSTAVAEPSSEQHDPSCPSLRRIATLMNIKPDGIEVPKHALDGFCT